jgi:N-acetylglucosamine-6-phosphate deacetylase
MAFALTGARIFDGDTFRDGCAVVVEGARIAAVRPRNTLGDDVAIQDLGGGLLAPGFIDVQVNGGGGVLFNERPDADGVMQIARAHRCFGTTGLLPTVITDDPEVMASAIAAVRIARDAGNTSILGIHIEGPFIDPERRGAHDSRFIRTPGEADFETLAAAGCGIIMLTVAPNKVSPEMIGRLVASGIRVSLGHAQATAEQAQAALQAGATAFTHLFNAMSQLTGREPGMVGAALADTRSYCGLIADGFHVHDMALQVAFAAKPHDRIMLVSDAMPPSAGGPDGFTLQGRTAIRRDGRLELADGTLAGSNLTMAEAVRYCVSRLGIGLRESLRAASLNPASFLGLEGELGRIAPGYLASLVHLRDDMTVQGTWVEGK